MTSKSPRYTLDEGQRFVIDEYNWARSFQNFLPGIAGKWGIPTWCYYVSRHQGICSMGVNDKNHQILEFLSFNKAVAQVGRVGYRTFLRADGGEVYEPFRKVRDPRIRQRMIVSSGELEIREVHEGLGLEIQVVYFALVGTRVPALVRQVRIRNVGDQARDLELLDGLPHVFPAGVDQEIIHVIPRHIEGMIEVAEHRAVPLMRLKQTPGDVEQVSRIEGGNFYTGFVDGAQVTDLVVDPAVVFGQAENYDVAWAFEDSPLAQLRARAQIRRNRTPCAFVPHAIRLAPGEETSICAYLGYVPRDTDLDPLLDAAADPAFAPAKRGEQARLLGQIKDVCLTVTADPTFDEYCQQTFLDNVIRGGMPLSFDTADGPSAFYLYSRQNGDLERDYHYFVVDPTYLSQGTGHYRSVLQNRRCDTWFFPEIEDFNVRLFTSLTQLDSYSPLEVLQSTYAVKDRDGIDVWLAELAPDADARAALTTAVVGSFAPGEFVMKLEDLGLLGDRDREALVRDLLGYCSENEVGGRLHLGFWVDHWSYNLDTLEVVLMVYPERLGELLLERLDYTFFDNPDQVRTREQKHVFHRGRVRQYDAVVTDEEKLAQIAARAELSNRVRGGHGDGEVYRTHLLGKLLVLVANRAATLDPDNVGVEMEANKPGWNDSMSAVAGIFGSSVGQAFELERMSRFLLDALGRAGLTDEDEVALFEELAELIGGLANALEQRLASTAEDRRFAYWNKSHDLKEAYRARVRMGVSGRDVPIPVGSIRAFLSRVVALFDELYEPQNRARAFHESGVPYMYLSYDVPEFEELLDGDGQPQLSHQGYPLVRPTRFERRPLKLFLEGPVHYLRAHPERRDEVYGPVKQSDIWDRPLSMYKVCESLADETFEIGRVHAWGAGWIENESNYTHMSYKYLLELIRSGLVEEFWADARTGLMSFLDPEVYGRSPLENVSFVVSSAFADPSMHGQGLQPRLSGVTNEMLHIWVLMMAGERPLFLDDDGQLGIRLAPSLPDWLFTDAPRTVRWQLTGTEHRELEIGANSLAFLLFGRCLVTYHNPSRLPTWDSACRILRYHLTHDDGRAETVEGDTLGAAQAQAVREGRIPRIDVVLG